MAVNRKRFLCIDCGRDTGLMHEFYYVHLRLWMSAVGSKEGMLCVLDLERRIGRQLTKNDFTDCFVNNYRKNSMSSLLVDRLRA